MGNWSEDNMVSVVLVGNEIQTFFWLDLWLEDDPLSNKFLHLFYLA